MPTITICAALEAELAASLRAYVVAVQPGDEGEAIVIGVSKLELEDSLNQTEVKWLCSMVPLYLSTESLSMHRVEALFAIRALVGGGSSESTIRYGRTHRFRLALCTQSRHGVYKACIDHNTMAGIMFSERETAVPT